MKKLLGILFGLAVLGMTSVFAIEGKRIDPRTLYKEYPVSYTFKITNKSANDVSIIMIKYSGDTKADAIEYVIPAKSSETIEFNETVDSLKGEWWGFGWVNSNGSIGNGSCDWWSQQKEIIIDKDGYLTYKDNGSTKKMSQIQKL